MGRYLKKDGRELQTYLEPEDADGCMVGRQCVSLGLQIAQLKAILADQTSTI
jgi:hypothetical protein